MRLDMNLELPYYSNKVKVLNIHGTVGILTLWSKVDVVIDKIGNMPKCVAAISNFYGDGLSELLANLLYNPQIDTICIIGNNKTKSAEDLIAYFDNGTIVNESGVAYVNGTSRPVHSAVADVGLFKNKPKIVNFVRDDHYSKSVDRMCKFLSEYKSTEHTQERISVDLSVILPDVMPSHIACRQIVSDDILEAWKDVVFAIRTYGTDISLKKGDRRELSNLKVVITNPKWSDYDDYSKIGLDKNKLMNYAFNILNHELTNDISYSYGNRLHRHFNCSIIDKLTELFNSDLNRRDIYYSLWSNDDIDSESSSPCWASFHCRIINDKLHFNVVFRVHRAFSAWVENVHGLMYIQSVLCESLDIDAGPLTVYSHSIGIDPSQFQFTDELIASRSWRLIDDHVGSFIFSIDGDEAVVQQSLDGLIVREYRGSNVVKLSHDIYMDMAVYDPGHAIYIGRQLGKLEMCLRSGVEFIQD